MAKNSKYVSRKPDAKGYIEYTPEEHRIWETLIRRQLKLIENRACNEYIQGVHDLQLPLNRIPQLPDLSAVLQRFTGWNVVPVPALISFGDFFQLLANKRFPVATFIRNREDLDYLQEPDIFHEVFGHCPLLTNPSFAKFTETYGKLGLAASKEERVYLARLYWFTVEFGLINTTKGLRIYGGGILSSKQETVYSLNDLRAKHLNFSVIDMLRTPYRIDILQPVYFIINQLSDLDALCQQDLMGLVHQAMQLGLYEPPYDQDAVYKKCDPLPLSKI